jgi:hypothetical protein
MFETPSENAIILIPNETIQHDVGIVKKITNYLK